MGGQDANISTQESAEGIFTLATRTWKADDAMYLDYQDNPRRW
jgi:hypothetical protein